MAIKLTIDEFYPSKYLAAADLAGRVAVYTITGIEKEEFEEGAKPVLAFEETSKHLVTNKTNWATLKELFGNNLSGWVGQKIELYAERVHFGSKMVNSIRLRQPTSRPASETPGASDITTA